MRYLMIAWLAFISAATRVGAEEPPATTASPADVVKARAHFKAGSVFYEAGAYDEAIREYLAGYRLHPLPDFFFNVAQAYRMKGDLRNAIKSYNLFLKYRPEGKGSDDARWHVAELTLMLEEEEKAKSAAKTPPPAPAQQRPPAPAAPIRRGEPSVARPQAVKPIPTSPKPPSSPAIRPPVVTTPVPVVPKSTASAPEPPRPLPLLAKTSTPGKEPRTRSRWLLPAMITSAAVAGSLVVVGTLVYEYDEGTNRSLSGCNDQCLFIGRPE